MVQVGTNDERTSLLHFGINYRPTQLGCKKLEHFDNF
jgi:hypothetical protein